MTDRVCWEWSLWNADDVDEPKAMTFGTAWTYTDAVRQAAKALERASGAEYYGLRFRRFVPDTPADPRVFRHANGR